MITYDQKRACIERELPSISDLRAMLLLDAARGGLTWLCRPREMFSSDNACNSWNAKWGGKGAFTAVDGHGYRVGAIRSTLHRAHRVIWALHYGAWPEHDIDHINGDKLDNRPANLRLVSHAENMMNLPLKANNTSGVLGVSWDKRDRKWRASIKQGGRQETLGYFWTFEAAVKARKDAEVRLGFHPNHGRVAS